MSVIADFRKLVAQNLEPRGLKVSLWGGATRISNHMLEISTVPKPTVLYIKVSSTAPGFWGITKNQIDGLVKSNARWFCLLLRRQPNVGYLLSGGQIVMRITNGSLTLSRGD
jgi:hypothetical protein